MATAVIVNNSNTLTTGAGDPALGASSTKKHFDPTDPSFQVNPQFLPDKEKTWTHPKETDGWMHAHNSLRREMKFMVRALKAAKSRNAELRNWEVSSIQLFWDTHFAHVHAHHHNEDDIMVPYLKTRFHYPEKAITDHEGLERQLDKLSDAIKALKPGDMIDEIARYMEEYENMMLPHLKEEEDECLPLLRAYFTAKDVAPKVQEIIGKGPKVEIGSLVACMGVDRWRKEFMPQEGIPGFVWFLDFKARFKLFQKNFETPIDAVTTGVQAEAASGCCA